MNERFLQISIRGILSTSFSLIVLVCMLPDSRTAAQPIRVQDAPRVFQRPRLPAGFRNNPGQGQLIFQFDGRPVQRDTRSKLYVPVVPPPPPLPTRTPISPERQEALISQLESGAFQERMTATRILKSQGGVESISQLVTAAESGSPELSMRALSILEAIFLSPDDEANREAERALQVMAEDPQHPLAFQAEEILFVHAQMRTKRATVDLMRMGLYIEYSKDFFDTDDLTGELLPSISFVRISRNWTGGEEGIKQIARLSGVRAVYVITTSPVSPERVEELLFPLIPETRIEKRSAARLGIEGASITLNPPGVMINKVTPGKSAQLAGIQSNDVITHVEGKETAYFEQLTKRLERFEPGDVIEVIVTRPSNPRSARVVDVTLKGW